MNLKKSIAANDGVTISFHYAAHPTSDTCIILIHGFSGSADYFRRNFASLSERHSIVAYDLRGHGGSGRSPHGYHVNRLAADLRDLINHCRTDLLTNVKHYVGVGCSIGAAILWSYTELFTCKDFHKFVFVDQAPLQNYTASGDWGPSQGNYGCHDAASTAWNQANLILDFERANQGLVGACLGYRFAPLDVDGTTEEQSAGDEHFFTSISKQCDPRWIGKLMGDHTQYDHRDTIEHGIDIPCLVMAGRRSGCFPLVGSFRTAELINARHAGLAQTLEFQSGHWLFYEEPDRFNNELLTFIAG